MNEGWMKNVEKGKIFVNNQKKLEKFKENYFLKRETLFMKD